MKERDMMRLTMVLENLTKVLCCVQGISKMAIAVERLDFIENKDLKGLFSTINDNMEKLYHCIEIFSRVMDSIEFSESTKPEDNPVKNIEESV